MMTGLTNALQCTIPVIQAPMAGISTVKMAADVTRAGGLGSLPFGTHNLSKSLASLKSTVTEFQALIGDGYELTKNGQLRVNLNFYNHDIDPPPTEKQQQTWFDAYREFKPNPDKISFANGNVLDVFHFGCPPKDVVTQLKRTSLVMVTVTNVAEAKFAMDAGVDGLIVQGWEAGGPRGTFMPDHDQRQSTWESFTAVTSAVAAAPASDCYIVPAGGIVRVSDVQRYMDAGADMVLMGSAFLLCPESNATHYFHSQLDRRLPTQMVSFISGKPTRGVATPFIENLMMTSGKLDVPFGYMYTAYRSWMADVKSPEYAFYIAGDKWRLAENGVHAADVVRQFDRVLPKNRSTRRKA
ncbi:hypothetical protein DIURU_005511 [Diutina rugosa]|uniref:Uncharacterized protein n=1 Tax=Diutina rugosa TaxID=5481 RepID=A0A642UD58_DIURU|nr:uncharacterized protein DIURU_005511 [Diutina rugosa]KAA8896998.1 hypothetical protein DIURU_005511 [Diutina rugosa]